MLQRFTSILVVSFFTVLALAWPAQAANVRDCDTNAVIYCGAYSKEELAKRLEQGDQRNSAKSIQAAMAWADIDRAELAAAVRGEVRRDGSVWVKGERVAKNAQTLGRQKTPGDTRVGEFWQRRVGENFAAGVSSIPAFVYLKDGQFEWAVVKSCGNPVKAKRTKKTLAVQAAPKPDVVEQVAEQPPQLPDTGAGAAAGLVGVSAISAGVYGLRRGRQRLQAALKRV